MLKVAASELEQANEELPTEWTVATRAAIRSEIATEARDRSQLSRRSRSGITARGGPSRAEGRRARRGAPDHPHRPARHALGQQRPDAINALVATVEEKLDAARRLRLARDRWDAPGAGARAVTAPRSAAPLDMFAHASPGARGHQVAGRVVAGRRWRASSASSRGFSSGPP